MGFPFQRQSRPRERRGSPEPFVVSPDKSPASDSLPSPPVSRPRGKPRRKFECLRWGNIVINLPRHTREVHGIEPRKTKKSKSGYVLRYCAIPGCHRIVSRLQRHITRYHKINAENSIEDILRNSKPVVSEISR